jgi:hypothetical protein
MNGHDPEKWKPVFGQDHAPDKWREERYIVRIVSTRSWR